MPTPINGPFFIYGNTGFHETLSAEDVARRYANGTEASRLAVLMHEKAMLTNGEFLRIIHTNGDVVVLNADHLTMLGHTK